MKGCLDGQEGHPWSAGVTAEALPTSNPSQCCAAMVRSGSWIRIAGVNGIDCLDRIRAQLNLRAVDIFLELFQRGCSDDGAGHEQRLRTKASASVAGVMPALRAISA